MPEPVTVASEPRPAFEAVFTGSSTRFVRAAPWPHSLLFMIVAPSLAERVANSLVGWTSVRAASAALAVVVMWRFYVSFVARLRLTDSSLELTRTKDVKTFAREDLAWIRVFSFAAYNSYTVITVKTRERWLRYRFRCLVPGNALTFEQKLLEQCRARGITGSSSTIVLWRR